MMVEQQQHNPIVSVQSQHQQHHNTDEQQQQHFIVPTSTTTTSVIDTTTITSRDQDFTNSKSDKEKNDRDIHVGNEITTIKQVLMSSIPDFFLLKLLLHRIICI